MKQIKDLTKLFSALIVILGVLCLISLAVTYYLIILIVEFESRV